MEGQLWKAILNVLSQLDKRRKRAAERFSDEEIVQVFYASDYQGIQRFCGLFSADYNHWAVFYRERGRIAELFRPPQHLCGAGDRPLESSPVNASSRWSVVMVRCLGLRWLVVLLLVSPQFLPAHTLLAQGIVIPGQEQKPGNPKYTADQQRYLNEKAKSLAQIEAMKATNLSGAIKLGLKLLEADTKGFGEASEPVIETLNVLAPLLYSANEIDLSITAKQDIVKAKEKLYGETDWRANFARWEAIEWKLHCESPEMIKANGQQLALLNQANEQLTAGRYEEAIASAQRAEAIIRDMYEPDDVPPRMAAMRFVGKALNMQRKYAEATKVYEELAPLYAGWFTRFCPDYVENLLDLASNATDLTTEERHLREAVEICDKMQGYDRMLLARALSQLARNYEGLQRFAQGKELIARAISVATEAGQGQAPGTMQMRLTEAKLDRGQKKYAEAEAEFKQVVAYFDQGPAEYFQVRVEAHREMALLYRLMSKYDLATAQITAAMDFVRKKLGEKSSDYGILLLHMGLVQEEQGDLAKAIPLYEQSLAINQKILPANSQSVIDPAICLSRCLRAQANQFNRDKNYAAARKKLQYAVDKALPLLAGDLEETSLETTLAIQDQLEKLPADQLKVVLDAEAAASQAEKAIAASNMAEAEQHLRRAIQLHESLGDKQIPYVVAVVNVRLGDILRAQSKFQESLAPLSAAKAAYDVFFKNKPLTNEYPEVSTRLGISSEKLGNFADAIRHYSTAIELYRRMGDANANAATYLLPNLVRCYLAQNDFTRALSVGRQRVSEIERIHGKQSIEYVDAVENLGRAEFSAGQFQPARDHFAQAISVETAIKPDSAYVYGFRQWLAWCDVRLGNTDAAIAEFEKLLAEAREAKNGNRVKFATTELSALQLKKGDLDAAEKLAEETLALATELQGQDAAAVAADWIPLRDVWGAKISKLESEKKFSEAAVLRERLLAKTSEYGGADGPYLAAHRAQLETAKKLASLTAEQQQAYLDAKATLLETTNTVTAAGAAKALAAAQQIEKLLGAKSLAVALAYEQAAESQPTTLRNAEAAYRKALNIYRDAVGEDSISSANCHLELGRFLRDLGRYQESAVELNKSIEILNRQDAAGSAYTIARNKVVLAGVNLNLGNLGAATQNLDEADAVLLAGQADSANRRMYIVLLSMRGSVAGYLGDFQERLRFNQLALERGVREFGEQSIAAAIYHTMVAASQITLSKIDDAKSSYELAKKILVDLGQEDSSDFADTLNGLAAVAMYQKEYAKGTELAEQALKLFAAHLGENSLRYREGLVLVARLYMLGGKNAEAENAIRQALKTSEQGEEGDSTVKNLSLQMLAEVLERQGKLADASQVWEQALTTYEKMLASATSYQTESQQAGIMAAARQQLGFFVFATGDNPEQNHTAYDHVLWMKGSIFARQRRLRELRSNPAAADLLARWTSVTGALATLAMRPPYAEDQAIWNQRIALLTADKDAIERELLGMAKQKELPRVTVDQVRKTLPAKSALIDFFAFDLNQRADDNSEVRSKNLRAFIVRPDRTEIAQIDIKNVGELNDLINVWRETLDWDQTEAFQAVKDNEEAVQSLFANAQETQQKVADEIKELLWAPLQKELEGVEQVIVSPDGPLSKFPLVALPGAKKHTYLIEDLMISSVAVPSMLPELMAKNLDGETESLLLLGDINYGGSGGSVAVRGPQLNGDVRGWLPFSFSPLPGVLPEIKDIASFFGQEFPKGQEDMFVESKATEGIFRVEAPKHRWVHLATHGFYSPEMSKEAEEFRFKSQIVPNQSDDGGAANFAAVLNHEGLKSGLALAGANEINREGQDDGILSAMEVSSMDLSNVEMTMLSACQTGLGESLSGEGVAGLQRAFQVAGVRSTVTSLWSVDDTAARLLAARFYRNLWVKKMSKSAAMREAQSWMIAAAFRDNGKIDLPEELTIDAEVLPGRFRLPKCWAPFVLSGDWR